MNDAIHKAKAVLLRDKKKTGLMLGLLAVGLLMWGRLMLKEVPRTASATDTAVVASAASSEGPAIGKDRAKVSLSLPGSLQRDLFRLDPSRYIRTDKDEVLDKPQKSSEVLSDELVRREVIAAARGLRLQSVTMGDVPAAFINGRLIRIGRTVEGFTLLHCDERSAVLERSNIKVRIGM